MGKASSSKKVARAARAAGRPGARKNYAWPMTIGAVVIVGVLLIVLTVSTNDDSETGSPTIGEHWHASYGIYDCDHYITPLVDVVEDRAGIHTHGDGLMHIHPFSTRASGDGANIGAFASQIGLEVTDTSIKAEGIDRENGDECDGKPGHLELATWDSPSDETPTIITKDFSDYDPDNQSIWALAFVAEGTDVPKPASAANLADPTAAEEGRQPVTGGVESSSTTAPAETSSTTAPESTTTTAAP